MNDDWRVHVTCPTTATAAELSDLLRAGEVQHELETAAGERVIVSVDGRELFLYAGTREQAERAIAAVGSLFVRSGVTAPPDLRRWHPVSEEWVDADAPLPQSETARAAEHAELIEQQRREQAELRYAEWEVRVSTASHRETVELVDTLRAEGIPALRRWRFLLVGAADEDAARALAQRIGALAPADARIEVEASYPTVEAEVGPNPFAVFGGLGV
ncbi:MAG TPA: hypothetical protein VFN36_05560 [Solirubrobacteraceae bacterium]|nr:hypothetical protein [Solirubrobacteraceae bacterium]